MTEPRDSVTAAELDETKRLFRAMPGTRIPLDMQEGIELWGEVENSEEWEFCEKFGRELAALRRELDGAMREATGLATALHRRWYYEVTQWRPITDSVAGVISQIDNMSAGIGQQLDDARADIAKKDAALREAQTINDRSIYYNATLAELLARALAPAPTTGEPT